MLRVRRLSALNSQQSNVLVKLEKLNKGDVAKLRLLLVQSSLSRNRGFKALCVCV